MQEFASLVPLTPAQSKKNAHENESSAAVPQSGGPVDPGEIDDLVAANRILADQGVLDGYGHVSMRHSGAADRYFLSRSKSPAIIVAEDIMAYDLDSNPGRSARPAHVHRALHPWRNLQVAPRCQCGCPQPLADRHPVQRHRRQAAADLPHVGILKHDVPNFEIRECDGMTDLLIRNAKHGAGLARTLGLSDVALMRGHGNVCVGPNIMTGRLPCRLHRG